MGLVKNFDLIKLLSILHSFRLPCHLSHMQAVDLNCEICGDGGMALSLLYCDNYVYGCTGARHAHCLRPPQRTVEGGGWTIGGWFCNLCSKHMSKDIAVGKKMMTEMLEAESDTYMQQCENDEKKVKALNKKVAVGVKVTREEEREEAEEQSEEDEVLGAALDGEKKKRKLESQKKKKEEKKGDEGKEEKEENEEEDEKANHKEEEDGDEHNAMTMALTHIQNKIAAEEAKQIKYRSLVQNVEEREWYISLHDNEAADIANIGSNARGPWRLQELYRFADMMGRSDRKHGEVFRARFEDLVVNRGGEGDEAIRVGDLLDAMQ